ncbi:MAG: hypothetical protein EOO50_12390 [Flavobacterium sp.]|uniref:hypothetical protein n=1 Tax=Flavobacterium sp. TaxID=239 RepID=UPI001200BC89|nr:hypothetical protein [Flavobacterium sp.]RZJ65806.1 MAG: hypothetical protein EOO50_12390 [Flavobacterium sp.]
MTSTLPVVIVIAALLTLVFVYRKSIAKHLDREIEKNQELNETDDEKEYLRQLYSSLSSDELIAMKNSGHLPEKEVAAIERVLIERQMPPPLP